MRWLRIAIGFTISLLTLLCLLPAQAAAQGSGWAVLLDEQADLQLSDIRSARYTNQFSPIELDELTAAEPDESGAWRKPAKIELRGTAGTLFDAGRLKSAVDIQTAVQEEALAAYEAAAKNRNTLP